MHNKNNVYLLAGNKTQYFVFYCLQKDGNTAWDIAVQKRRRTIAEFLAGIVSLHTCTFVVSP